MAKLSREDMMRAVADGVRDAMLEVFTDDGNLSLLRPGEILEAIRAGARDAMLTVAAQRHFGAQADEDIGMPS
jgi:hypothetical protein